MGSIVKECLERAVSTFKAERKQLMKNIEVEQSYIKESTKLINQYQSRLQEMGSDMEAIDLAAEQLKITLELGE